MLPGVRPLSLSSMLLFSIDTRLKCTDGLWLRQRQTSLTVMSSWEDKKQKQACTECCVDMMSMDRQWRENSKRWTFNLKQSNSWQLQTLYKHKKSICQSKYVGNAELKWRVSYLIRLLFNKWGHEWGGQTPQWFFYGKGSSTGTQGDLQIYTPLVTQLALY